MRPGRLAILVLTGIIVGTSFGFGTAQAAYYPYGYHHRHHHYRHSYYHRHHYPPPYYHHHHRPYGYYR